MDDEDDDDGVVVVIGSMIRYSFVHACLCVNKYVCVYVCMHVCSCMDDDDDDDDDNDDDDGGGGGGDREHDKVFICACMLVCK
jgi:hypothetical protein